MLFVRSGWKISSQPTIWRWFFSRIVSNILHRDIEGHGRHYTVSVADRNEAKRFGLLIEPHLTSEKLTKVERHLYEWESRGSATNIGIPSSFLGRELERRAQVTGRSRGPRNPPRTSPAP